MKFKNYKLVSSWPYLATIFALIVLVPMQTSAAVLSGLVKLLVQPIWNFFFWPLTWTIQLEMELLRLVARYNNFTSEGGVMLGWIALRDLSNMFFILILLVIAFATILRISNYGYQQLLKKTFIIAILINFSKTIVGFVIDIAQVVMLTFISAIDEVMAGGIVVAIGLQKITMITAFDGPDSQLDNYILALILGSVFLAILVVVMGVMVMMLMMRIVALWVAIVLAPLAFVASIFPATKSFYSRWLKELGTNLVTGPMLAFFMWLTFTIVGNGQAYQTFLNDNPSTPGPTEFLGTSNMVNYIVAISLLLMGIKMASASGAAGASFAAKGMGMINNTASKFARRYPMAVGKRLAGWAAGGLVDKDGKARSLQAGANRIINSRFGERLRLTSAAGHFKETATSLQGSDKWLGRVAGRTMTGAKDLPWNRIPFYGGRLQREAMKAQGRRSAMIDEFQAEDEKFINPRQREQFEASQDTVKGGPKFLSRVPILNRSRRLRELGVWDAAGGVTSLGGNADRRTMRAKTMVDRNTVSTQEEANFAAEHLERVNDQARLDKLHSGWANTYRDGADAERDINEKGAATVITSKDADSILDKDGKMTEGAGLLIKEIIANKNTEGATITKALLKSDKKLRGAWAAAFVQYEAQERARLLKVNELAEREDGIARTKINPETGRREVDFNNKQAIQFDDQNALVKLAEVNLGTYPGNGVDGLNGVVTPLKERVGDGRVNFNANAIDHIQARADEGDDAFEERKAASRVKWQANEEAYQASNKTEEDKDKLYRVRRNLMGHYTEDDYTTAKAELTARGASPSEFEELEQARVESPVFKAMGSEAEFDRAARAYLGERPSGGPKIVEAAEVSDEAVDELVKKRKTSISEEAITARVQERGPDYGDPLNPGVARNKAKKELIAEADDRDAAKAELIAVEQKKAGAQNVKNASSYDADRVSYDAEFAKIRQGFKDAFTEAQSSPQSKRLTEVNAEKSRLEAIPNDQRSDAEWKTLADLIAEGNTLAALQNRLERQAIGLVAPNNKNLYTNSALKNATDGADYSRLEEMDIKIPEVRALFEDLAKVATQRQQRELLEAGNAEQIKLFAETLGEAGVKLNKAITDNLAVPLRERVYRNIARLKKQQEGMTPRAARARVAPLKGKDLEGEAK